MDKFANGSWATYNMATEEVDNYEPTPLDHPPWPYYPHAAAANLDADPREEVEEEEELGAVKEMMFKIAAMQPVDIDPSSIRKPRRRNVRISDDPQSVAARHRRERISEKIRILQRLVPGGTKMDTASMLDEAIRYVKFLKRQIRLLQGGGGGPPDPAAASVFEVNNQGDDLPVCFSGRMFIGD